MNRGDQVRVVKYTDEESDEPRTDMVGKIGVVSQVWPDYVSAYVDGQLFAFYEDEIEKV